MVFQFSGHRSSVALPLPPVGLFRLSPAGRGTEGSGFSMALVTSSVALVTRSWRSRDIRCGDAGEVWSRSLAGSFLFLVVRPFAPSSFLLLLVRHLLLEAMHLLLVASCS